MNAWESPLEGHGRDGGQPAWRTSEAAGRRWRIWRPLAPAGRWRLQTEMTGWLRRDEHVFDWTPGPDLPLPMLRDRLADPLLHAQPLANDAIGRIERWAWRWSGYRVDWRLPADWLGGLFELRRRYSFRGHLAQGQGCRSRDAVWLLGERAGTQMLCARIGTIHSSGVSNMSGRDRLPWVVPLDVFRDALANADQGPARSP
ncbi:MAG: hypothetical protein KDI56_05475 [Xanthomonadales bacterium]|nr:hypothetical protein [Xanthomonadales bacterium]